MSSEKSFPSLEGITENIGDLRIVSPAYAGRDGELTAVLQYVYQSVVLGACGREDAAKTLMRIARDEMRHLQILGSLITRLGAPPVFTACPPYPVGYYSASCVNYVRSFEGMLCASLHGERAAIACYRGMLRNLCSHRVREIVEWILQEELGHVALLEELARANGLD